jgi:recombination protein RecR
VVDANQKNSDSFTPETHKNPAPEAHNEPFIHSAINLFKGKLIKREEIKILTGYTRSMRQLITELTKMPGIGPRSAERLAFHIINLPFEEARLLALNIVQAKKTIRFCKICFNLSEREVCQICDNPGRNRSLLCIVEEPKDIIAIEKSGTFKGLYHVLLGAIAPLEGVGPEKLKVKELISRLRDKSIKEVIIATDSDSEGETTSLYLTKLIKPLGLKITRIAHGIPVGGNLEFADSATLARAFEGRTQL